MDREPWRACAIGGRAVMRYVVYSEWMEPITVIDLGIDLSWPAFAEQHGRWPTISVAIPPPMFYTIEDGRQPIGPLSFRAVNLRVVYLHLRNEYEHQRVPVLIASGVDNEAAAMELRSVLLPGQIKDFALHYA